MDKSKLDREKLRGLQEFGRNNKSPLLSRNYRNPSEMNGPLYQNSNTLTLASLLSNNP
jgi:hypothetical protein